MVVRRRAMLMGAVAVVSLLLAVLYAVRFASDRDLVSFLVCGLLVVVGVVHAMSWSGARTPLLIVDMTGLRLRLGGEWAGLTWSEVDRLELRRNGRWSEGRLTVVPRDPMQVAQKLGPTGRLAIALNRWLYEEPLVVTYGPTSVVSVPDLEGTLRRLADGRVDLALIEPRRRLAGLLASGERLVRSDPRRTAAEGAPEPMLEWDQDLDGGPIGEATSAPVAPVRVRPAKPPRPSRSPAIPLSGPGRAVVSAIRGLSLGRAGAGEDTVPLRSAPLTVGSLALSEQLGIDTEPLPELEQLRRRAPEHDEASVTQVVPVVPVARAGEPDELGSDDESEQTMWVAQPGDRHDDMPEPLADAPEQRDEPDGRPHRTANVELVIDATTDLTARTMRRFRDAGPAGPEAGDAKPSDGATVGRRTVWGFAPQTDGGSAAGRVDTKAVAAARLGSEISEARRRIGVTIDDLASRTRVRPPVIEAIERGDFGPCGGDFYARGHLRMLAGALGIDPDPLLATYDDSVAGAPVSPREVFDAELATSVMRPTGRGSRWGALIATVLVLLLAWGIARFVVGDVAHGSAPAPRGAVGVRHATTDRAAAPLLPGGPVRITLTAHGAPSSVTVWNADRTVVYSGVVTLAHPRIVTGPGPLRVTAAHAANLTVATGSHAPASFGASHGSATRAIG